MFEFWKSYYYVFVKLRPDSKVYSYKSASSSIHARDVVIVPTPDGEKMALVIAADHYLGKDAPYPVEKTKDVIAKVSWEVQKQFTKQYKNAYWSLPRSERREGEFYSSYWTKKDRLVDPPVYQCNCCRSRFMFAPRVCPSCHANMTRISYEAVWLDELEFLEG